MTFAGRWSVVGLFLALGACANPGGPAPAPSVAAPGPLPVTAKFDPVPIAAPEHPPAPPVTRCDFSVVLASDQLFAGSGYALSDESTVPLAHAVMVPLAACGNLELITITGHTDHLGHPQALQTLSERRAEAVKAFLVRHGIPSARISALGQGSTHPVSDGCAHTHPHGQQIACLAADRRIVVEVKGIAR